jgi:hypothetical protein
MNHFPTHSLSHSLTHSLSLLLTHTSLARNGSSCDRYVSNGVTSITSIKSIYSEFIISSIIYCTLIDNPFHDIIVYLYERPNRRSHYRPHRPSFFPQLFDDFFLFIFFCSNVPLFYYICRIVRS